MSVDPILTVPEVAEIVRKKHRAVRDELKRGNLRGAYYLGAWHIKQSDVDAYVEAHMNVRPVEKRARRAS